ncbi:MAG: hypothetical protein MJZ41_13015 [Bacteroidaceae bacterium]|nr:hypothetical protein [Bacteroidaceae bacterium]
MSSLSKNEIITLELLSDGLQHNEAPSRLTEAQFYVAVSSLKSRDMVYAAFGEGEEVEATQIKKAGQAELDEMKSTKNRILRKLLSPLNLTVDQYTLIKYTQEHGISSSSEAFAQEHFDVDCDYYKKNIWGQLTREDYLDVNEERTGMIMTRKGYQLLEEIEDELYELLSNGGNASSVNSSNTQTENTNTQNDPALATLLQENLQLKERLEEYEKPIAIAPHDKIRLELTLRFLESSGAQYNAYGAKTKVAKILNFITGIRIQTCKNFLSDRVVNKETHSEEIKEVNGNLTEIGIIWQL